MEILGSHGASSTTDSVEDFPEDAWDTLIAVLLTTPFLLAPCTLPHLPELAWGRIVSMGSVHGLVASPHKAAYVAGKHGLVGLTTTIALEAAARSPDRTAHTIWLSYVPTPLVRAQIDAQAAEYGTMAEAVVADLLLGPNAVERSIEDEHVAEVVVDVCGPGAWTTTGAAIPMDAGWPAN